MDTTFNWITQDLPRTNKQCITPLSLTIWTYYAAATYPYSDASEKYTIFINGHTAIYCLDTFSKIKMLPNYKAVQRVLSWEVSTFLVKQLQIYGSFKFKTFVWEMIT